MSVGYPSASMTAGTADPELGLVEQAIDWMVLLGSGTAHARDRQAFERWLAQDPRHAQAWQSLEGLIDAPLAQLRAVPGEQALHTRLAYATLLRPRQPGRRRALRLALLLAGAGLGAATLDRHVPLTALSAHHATRTGERRTLELDDGSRLTLNARSAVDVHYSPTQRLVRLRQGELYADVRPDSRPFDVLTEFGRVRSGAAPLNVRLCDDATVANATHQPLQVRTRAARQQDAAPGSVIAFDHQHIWTPAAHGFDSAWTQGILNVRDARLADVIDHLRAYQPGLIRVSAAVASLRVFGVFRLNAPEQTLVALGDILPIRVRRYGGLLTLIEAA